MRTRKKIVADNGSPEPASPRVSRRQRKVTVIAEKKVKELITSVKKQKSAVACKSKIRDVVEARHLNATFALAQDDNHGLCAPNDESSDKIHAECESDTIFSPAYHHPKDGSGGIGDKDKNNQLGDETKATFLNSQASLDNQLVSIEMKMGNTSVHSFDRNTDLTGRPSEASKKQLNDGQAVHTDSNQASKSGDDKYNVVGALSSEVSAIYLAMQHSKLECADEESQDSISTEGCPEPDDEFDDFDPYSFIKDLPDLSAVVPKFRPVLLPKQTRSCPSTTLVLDLDETLVHSSLEPCQDADFTFPVNFNLKEHKIYVRCRPYLKDFLERVAGLFETIIFTASQGIYAEQLLNILDPKRKLFRHRVYRESCVYVDGNYLKDLSVLGRDLARVIIIDNSPQAFGFQLENGIPIESWFDDQNDQELLSLLPFLESLVGVDDVRPIIAKKFNLREKVAASTCLSLDFRM